MGVTESHLLALSGDTLAEDDAEWMPGKSRTRLAPDLDNGFLMDASGKSTDRGSRSQDCRSVSSD
jgi:hypothetical protein